MRVRSHFWNSLKPSRHTDGHFTAAVTSLGTDVNLLHLQLQYLVSDVTSAGEEPQGVAVFCSLLNTFQAKICLSGSVFTTAHGIEDSTPATKQKKLVERKMSSRSSTRLHRAAQKPVGIQGQTAERW